MHQIRLHTIYSPNRLLNVVMQHLGLQSDGQLSRHLKIARNILQDIRNGHLPIAASILLAIQEATGFSLEELRNLMGDRRAKFRPAYAIHPRRFSHGDWQS